MASTSRAGTIGPGVTACFSVASSRSAAARRIATHSSGFPAAQLARPRTTSAWMSICSAQYAIFRSAAVSRSDRRRAISTPAAAASPLMAAPMPRAKALTASACGYFFHG